MKIMFICTGNICRSAMAHWLLKKKTEDLGRVVSYYIQKWRLKMEYGYCRVSTRGQLDGNR